MITIHQHDQWTLVATDDELKILAIALTRLAPERPVAGQEPVSLTTKRLWPIATRLRNTLLSTGVIPREVPRCQATHTHTRFPYLSRCMHQAGHDEGVSEAEARHLDRHGNTWPSITVIDGPWGAIV